MATAARPRTPSRSTATPNFQSPPIPNDENVAPQGQRRSSFGFLRRGKSVERLNSKRSVSGGKLKKLSKSEVPETSGIPERPPKIPDLATHTRLSTFGGDGTGDSKSNTPRKSNAQAQSMPLRSSPYYNVPIPQIPASPRTADSDPYSRTESMRNRGRCSYASSAVSTLNSPRRVRRRKDPTPFNVLVIGARNSGKTSFIDFLQSSLTLPPRKQRPHQRDDDLDEHIPTRHRSPNFVSHYLETELGGERIGLTLWDSEGLKKDLVDLQLREITDFIESKFEETLSEEMKVVRSPGTKDPHIHCVILLLDPVNLNQTLSAPQKARESGYNGNFSNGKSYLRDTSPDAPNGLDENLDLQVLRSLQGKTTVIPVISKADTITIDHMQSLKRAVWKSLKEAKFDPFETLGLEEDEDAEDDDSEAIEEDDGDGEADLRAAQGSKKGQHSRHDSKRFNEADEDEMVRRERTGLLHPETSHLDSSSSSSASSFNIAKNSQPSLPHNHQQQSLQNLPSSTPVGSSSSTPHIPYSVLTPDRMVTPHQAVAGQVGRKFAWGFADPYNEAHCDFLRFRNTVFTEWFSELREASREMWYEEWRAQRLHKPAQKTMSPKRGAVDSGAANTTRQGMVPVGMMGNNVPSSRPTGGSHLGPRYPGGASSARASPNPQAMLIPVSTMDGEVGVAR